LKTNNQHIKNFFRFLEKKESRNIPDITIFMLFPEMINDDIWNCLFYSDKDTCIDLRTRYINKISGLFFDMILPFNVISKHHALAYDYDEMEFYTGYIINKKGEVSVKGLDINKFYGGYIPNLQYIVAAYINTLNWTRYDYIKYGVATLIPKNILPHHASAIPKGEDEFYSVIVDLKTGLKETSSFDLKTIEKLVDAGYGAAYFNGKVVGNLYSEISFYDDTKRTLVGKSLDGKKVLIDTEGNLIKILN